MRRILVAALAVTLFTGSVVAEARDHDRDSRHDERAHRDHDRGRDHARHRDSDRRTVVRHVDRDVHRHVDRDVHRHVDRNVHRHVDVHQHARFHAGHYYRPTGYRAYAWHRGARLPAAYYAPRYVVRDYRAYHLYAPPRGHHWVRVNNDVVLAAITTGVVVAVVNDLFY